MQYVKRKLHLSTACSPNYINSISQWTFGNESAKLADANPLSGLDMERKAMQNYGPWLNNWETNEWVVSSGVTQNPYTWEYRAERFSTLKSPLVGHDAGGMPAFVGWGSWSMSRYPWIRSKLYSRAVSKMAENSDDGVTYWTAPRVHWKSESAKKCKRRSWRPYWARVLCLQHRRSRRKQGRLPGQL